MTPSPSKTNALLCRLAMSGLMSSVGLTGLTALSAMVASPGVYAQATPDIQASTQIHKVQIIDGKENFIPTPVMALDDVIQYTMDYHNASDKVLSNVQVTFKIPNDMRYVGSSLNVQPTHTKATGDTEWQKYPILEYVQGRPKEVSPYTYDAFAWTIPRIEPKKTVRLVLRTKLVQRPTLVK